jgi:hypothetical protein
MDVTITMRVCDICERRDRPATRYTLTSENGEPKTRDLCAEDAAPIEKVFGPLETAEEEKPGPLYLNAAEEGAEEGEPAAKKATARKTTAKKTTAKKAAAPRRRGRTPVRTLDQIEAEKAAKAEQS